MPNFSRFILRHAVAFIGIFLYLFQRAAPFAIDFALSGLVVVFVSNYNYGVLASEANLCERIWSLQTKRI